MGYWKKVQEADGWDVHEDKYEWVEAKDGKEVRTGRTCSYSEERFYDGWRRDRDM